MQKTMIGRLQAVVIAMCPLLFGAIGVCAGEFYREGFESYREGDAWFGARKVSRNWGEFPKGIESARVSTNVAHSEKLSLCLANPIQTNDYAVYSAGWDKSMASARTYHRFFFYVPRSSSGEGIKFSFLLQQVNNRQAAFISFDERKGKTRIAATNGSGDGKIAFQDVGSWSYDQWHQVDVTLMHDSQKYDVSIDGEQPATNLIFRHASAWVGAHWGPEARVDWRISPGQKLYLDDITFSTDPVPPLDMQGRK